MRVEELLGHVSALRVERLGAQGATLAPGIPLPAAEVPAGAKVGDEVRVFVHLDSDDRPISTTRTPRLELGEVAFLTVTDVGKVGAFVDWGLKKELLVPFAEQTRELRVGERHPIGLYLDKTGRLAGTMRVSEMLEDAKGEFDQDEWVEGEAWRWDRDIGLFVIVERSVVGLVPASEPHALSRGEAARFRVTNVLPDGRIELSLRARAHEEIEDDAQKILEVLSRPRAPAIGDKSSPEAIRAAFGLSKKAFKRAAGRLLKLGQARLDENGHLVCARR